MSHLPKQQKIIDGKLYTFKHRFETKSKAEDSAKYQRMMHNFRTAYSIKVIKLPKDQWGESWNTHKWATYEYLGFFPENPTPGRGLGALFEGY
jgi:hypothetical protein